ncbi:MAG: acylphosphatase [Gammaproteobacteria bacterium RIFCSPHIGHO2_12_FULL_45_9]|nr:MAG: acylphosphatase [Gammaproteobacteria bacterium RIFCSPHIGHO2_12_FULL_45_9]
MTNKRCIHCYVTGHVQGVWFRASTKEQALKLGLTGWACNLPDGRVEVMASGEQAQLAELQRWLQQGPPLARVFHVSSTELPWQEFADFSVK